MDLIKKQVEGIIAQQQFYNFFTKKLNYSSQDAKETFTKLQDTLGLKLLTQAYFNALNNGQTLDSTLIKNNELIFQNNSWHQSGTTKFNYLNPESWYYKNNINADTIFNSNLYTIATDETIKKVAKHDDDDEIDKLTTNQENWDTQDIIPPVPTLATATNIQEYQKNLTRFQWWLRFRYQQYYKYEILPQLNETLFTMSNILDTILKVTPSNSTTKIEAINSIYAKQLQNWDDTKNPLTTNYRSVWEYKTNITEATTIDTNWATTPLPELINTGQLNPEFFTKLKSSDDKSLINTVDPNFSVNSFINNVSGDYKDAVNKTNTANWVKNNVGIHFFVKDNEASFAYCTPIYFIDVIQNLNFNFNRKKQPPLTIEESGYVANWNTSSTNRTITDTDF